MEGTFIALLQQTVFKKLHNTKSKIVNRLKNIHLIYIFKDTYTQDT